MPKKNNQKNKQKGGFWPFSTETKVDASGNPVAAAPAEPESGGWFSYFKPKGDVVAAAPAVAAPVVPPVVAAPVVPPAAAATNTGIVGGKKRNKSKKSKKSKKNRSKKH
jgi:hypothetical protein